MPANASLALSLVLVSACARPSQGQGHPRPEGASSAPSGVQYPPHTLSQTQLRVVGPVVNGRTYQLHVHLPGSYAEQPSKRYPVMFVTDAYWD